MKQSDAAGNSPRGPSTHARFQHTRWTIVMQVKDRRHAQEALEQLCRMYWPPIYAFIRGQGQRPEEARDLTQGFFVHLLGRQLVKLAEREQGKFRTFLLGCLKHFLIDQDKFEKAAKRGGASIQFSIDAQEAEEHFGQLPAAETPEALFDRSWAAEVMAQAEEQLRKDYASRGMLDVFEAIKGCTRDQLTPEAYPALRVRLGLSKVAFDTSLHRFRKRFGEVVLSIIADTVEPAGIEAELRHLMGAWVEHLASET